jgi:RNA polymerase sigma-70 factor, ECF subfamily
MPEITLLLDRLSGGDKAALDEIFPLVYQELHQIARGYLNRELAVQTLQPTELINEAYLRLNRQSHPDYAGRAHFYGISARIMRQILVDHARRRQAKKRGSAEPLLTEVTPAAAERPVSVLALDEALGRLAATQGRKSTFIEMRFFGGMTAEEIAVCAELPVQTVRRELRVAQAWLHKELSA